MAVQTPAEFRRAPDASALRTALAISFIAGISPSPTASKGTMIDTPPQTKFRVGKFTPARIFGRELLCILVGIIPQSEQEALT